MRIDLPGTGRQAIGNRVLGKFRSEPSWPRPNLISEEKAVLEGALKSESIHPIGGAVRFRLPEALNSRTRRSPESVVQDYALTTQTQGLRGGHPNGPEF